MLWSLREIRFIMLRQGMVFEQLSILKFSKMLVRTGSRMRLIVGGTAAHVHVSLKRGTPSPAANVQDVPGLNVLETEFIAGLMDHLQAVSAFVMPTFASYQRLMDGAWAVLPFSEVLTVGWNVRLLGSGE